MTMTSKVSSSNSEIKINIKETVESKLLDIAKGPLTCGWILGYVPLTKTKEQTLKFSYFGLSTIYCIFLTIFSVANFTYYHIYQTSLNDVQITSTITEKTSQVFDGLLMVVISLYFKISGIVRVKKTLRIWQGLVKLFEMSESAEFLECDISSWKKLHNNSLRSTLWHVIPLSIYVLCVFVTFMTSVLLVYATSPESKALPISLWEGVILLQWSLTSLFHSAYKLWILNFVKMYIVCLQWVTVELQNANRLVTITRPSPPLMNRHVIEISGARQNKHLETCLDFIRETENEIEKFNTSFGSTLVLEIILCISRVVMYSFLSCLAVVNSFKLTKKSKDTSFSFEDASYYSLTKSATLLSAISIPVLLFGKSLYDFGTVSSRLSSRARKMGVALEDLLINGEVHWSYKQKISNLSLRLIMHPPCITASNFFTVNRTLITSIIGALTTYLIVLVQFSDSEKMLRTNFSV